MAGVALQVDNHHQMLKDNLTQVGILMLEVGNLT